NAPIDASFSNFQIETFTKFIESSTLKLGGGINGTASVDGLESSPVFVSDITINDFYFANDTIGDINLKVDNQVANTFAADVTISGFGNDVNLKGVYVSEPGQTSAMDLVLNMNRLNMSTLEAFSFGSIRRTEGYINGQLDITGSPDAPRINGDLLFNDAELNVSMLNAQFILQDDAITFNDEGIVFRDFSIADSVGNEAVISGAIRTKTYTDFAFNLGVSADNFQVLNSTDLDNELFYGTLFINSDLRITGNLDNPVVNGMLRVNENTQMTVVVPDSEPGMAEREGIVEFVNKSDTSSFNRLAYTDSMAVADVKGMDISLNIDVDPDAEFNVVID